jgi:hypothetical protein
MTTATFEDMKDAVYLHPYELYGKMAMECFPYLTNDITNIISMSAYQEMIAMAHGGYLQQYYERLQRNAV